MSGNEPTLDHGPILAAPTDNFRPPRGTRLDIRPAGIELIDLLGRSGPAYSPLVRHEVRTVHLMPHEWRGEAYTRGARTGETRPGGHAPCIADRLRSTTCMVRSSSAVGLNSTLRVSAKNTGVWPGRA
jgi:hypothetical protein